MTEPDDISSAPADLPMTRDHPRHWRRNRYVYPVLSRRARGLSIGVNLNPDQRCTFACVYCQVDRRVRPGRRTVDLAVLESELNTILGLAVAGTLWQDEYLSAVPAELRHVRDIAFSGDGEPACFRNFDQAVAIAAQAKSAHGLTDVQIVVISNATCFHTQQFQRAVPILLANNGHVWAKLDAGTEDYYRRVNNSSVAFRKVLANIGQLALRMPVVIQTMLLRLDGQGPSAYEVAAYIGRLRHILTVGGRIELVQLYTVARPPAPTDPPTGTTASALPAAELDAIAAQVREAIAPVPVEVFYGTT